MLLNKIFTGVFDNTSILTIEISQFLLCVGAALIIGLFIALAYTYKAKYTKSFVVTLATLPSIVAVVIMMVNGNLGAGVAVAGAFSLVRFRSVPGTAKEIGAIFLAMCTGLAVGMGHLGYAILFSIIISIVNMIYTMSSLGNNKTRERTLKITIPEDLDYTGVFDDLFSKFTEKSQLIIVKTANMGSLFKLTYEITLKNPKEEKVFIDELRCRNGNLEITMSKQPSISGEL